MITAEAFGQLTHTLQETQATLIAVSKLKPVSDIEALYRLGQRDFGENYVQELVEKQAQLPADIRWHFIGHLQSNKVKYIAPFVHLIHGVDSFRLLSEINKQGEKYDRQIPCLLQLHIAGEETKFGLDEKEMIDLLEHYEVQRAQLRYVRIDGLMGMASFTADKAQVAAEFRNLKAMFQLARQSYFLGQEHFHILSMGMSGDYETAIAEGSTHVRIGSLLFGQRQ
ncbi:YggS family pyridoxal phosphate-dependent enzyme [Taibaiella koreensis]|uniref:YggS family pyridoxal phosphate-dependent enzyme n=1 Tax=Taibaiella koreensis TaxID=1268548 RepID=UPI000E59EC68|nr:YggS family pyridoxal phosphate-dependent enzyme [Taibaiella koreensis]